MSKELIVRLREAAAQRVASTAMIGAEDLSAAADALESLEAAYSGSVEAGKSLAKQALKAEQERDALAAELKALREQEQKPVAEFRGTLGVGEKTVYLIEPKGPLTRGKALYAHPTTARELTDEAIENLHMQVYKGPSIAPARMLSFARAIERHMKGEGK